jgi:hypothetical protein
MIKRVKPAAAPVAVPEPAKPGFEWRPATGPYTAGAEDLYLGKVKVGCTVWRGARGEPPWAVRVSLPGIYPKPETNKFERHEEAKARLERLVRTWLAWSGLQIAGEE